MCRCRRVRIYWGSANDKNKLKILFIKTRHHRTRSNLSTHVLTTVSKLSSERIIQIGWQISSTFPVFERVYILDILTLLMLLVPGFLPQYIVEKSIFRQYFEYTIRMDDQIVLKRDHDLKKLTVCLSKLLFWASRYSKTLSYLCSYDDLVRLSGILRADGKSIVCERKVALKLNRKLRQSDLSLCKNSARLEKLHRLEIGLMSEVCVY